MTEVLKNGDNGDADEKAGIPVVGDAEQSDKIEEDLGKFQSGEVTFEEPENNNLQLSPTWPSVYEDCRRMLGASALSYFLADIRKAIRDGVIADPSVIEVYTTLPITPGKVLPTIEQNKILFDKILKGTNNEFFMSLLLVATQTKSIESPLEPPREEQLPSCVDVQDEKSEKEAVYFINVNGLTKSIVVVFRGSVTPKDFVVDADPYMRFFPNPVHSIDGHPQEKEIGIHQGFSAYLNGKKQSLGEGKCKQIRERLIELQKEYPGYYIYCTGHSLGGALAILQAFDLATTPEIVKPVVCINIASPKVGNLSFRHAIQALEKMEQLRYLRVVNQKDVVPTMPDRACALLSCGSWCCPCLPNFDIKHKYFHAGVQLLLFKDGKCYVLYHQRKLTKGELIKYEIRRKCQIKSMITSIFAGGTCKDGPGDVLKNHSCMEYYARIEANKHKLDSKYLQHLYATRKSRQSIVLRLSQSLSRSRIDGPAGVIEE